MEAWRGTLFRLVALFCIYSTSGKEGDSDKSIGSESFAAVRNSEFFVDKTMLIEEIAKKKGSLMLITYPRQWGKTINLKMIRNFFESTESKSDSENIFKATTIDKNRKLTAWSMHGKYPVVYVDFKTVVTGFAYLGFLKSVKAVITNAFQDHKRVQESLQGEKDSGDLVKFQGYLQANATDDILQMNKIQSLETQKRALRNSSSSLKREEMKFARAYTNLTKLYRQRVRSSVNLPDLSKEEKDRRMKELNDEFDPLIKAANTSKFEAKREVRKLNQESKNINNKITEIAAGEIPRFENHIVESLSFLTKLLQRVRKTKVVVLIDAYDGAISNAYLNIGVTTPEQVVNIFGKLFTNLFKTNPGEESAIEFGVITGELNVAKEELFSGANNLVELNILDNALYKYYGFSSAEVSALFDHVFMKKKVSTSLSLDQFKEAFDGYRVSNDLTNELYSPLSIVKSLHLNRISSVFTLSGSIVDLKPLAFKKEFKPTIRHLASEGVEKVPLNRLRFETRELDDLRGIVRRKVKISEYGKNLLLRLLFSTGYVSLTNDEKNQAGPGEDPKRVSIVKATNQEIRTHLSGLLGRAQDLPNKWALDRPGSRDHERKNSMGLWKPHQ